MSNAAWSVASHRRAAGLAGLMMATTDDGTGMLLVRQAHRTVSHLGMPVVKLRWQRDDAVEAPWVTSVARCDQRRVCVTVRAGTCTYTVT